MLTALVNVTTNRLSLTLGDNSPIPATLTPVADVASADVVANIATAWTADLNAALTDNAIAGVVAVEITGDTVAGDGVAGGRLLRDRGSG